MKKSLLIGGLLVVQMTAAQKVVTTSSQTWLGYIQNMRFGKRWGATADVHYRTADHLVQGRNLSLWRAGAVYFINDEVQLTAGYARFLYYPAEAHSGVSRPEHRGWQQLQVFSNRPKQKVMYRLRLEERWRRRIASADALAGGYNFNYRARFATQLLLPLGKSPFNPGSVSLMLMDEVMLNFGKEIVYNTFDQNRLIGGVQWQLGKSAFLQAGYMHIFQQQPSGNRYRQSHVARLFYTHNLDLRAKKKGRS